MKKKLIEQRLVRLQVGQKQEDGPATTVWKDQRFLRGHSFRLACLEIARMLKTTDVVKVNIIGREHTGKTTLAGAVGHETHKILQKLFGLVFGVKILNDDDLLNFDTTIANLPDGNHILIYDDVSFLKAKATSQQLEKVKSKMTKIRHLEGGQDVKILEIKNFHYTLGLDKYMRQNDFSFFTSVGSSELDNMQKIVGVRYTPFLLEFQQMLQYAKTNEKFFIRYGSKGKRFEYKYRDPFIPVLFWNGHSLRYVVSPSREWIDPICSICMNKDEVSAENIPDWVLKMNKRHGPHITRYAVRTKLALMGIDVYPKSYKRAMRDLDLYLSSSPVDIEQLANYFKFATSDTKLYNSATREVLHESTKEENVI